MVLGVITVVACCLDEGYQNSPAVLLDVLRQNLLRWIVRNGSIAPLFAC